MQYNVTRPCPPLASRTDTLKPQSQTPVPRGSLYLATLLWAGRRLRGVRSAGQNHPHRRQGNRAALPGLGQNLNLEGA